MDNVCPHGAETPERFTLWSRTGGKTAQSVAWRAQNFYEKAEASREERPQETIRTYRTKAGKEKAYRQTTYNRIEAGKDAYVSAPIFQEALGRWKRKWSANGYVTTVQLSDGTIVKRLEKFTGHAHNERLFTDFLRESRENGAERPSSYPDVFHSMFSSPHVRTGVNGLFAPVAHYGWQEALRPGRHKGHWYRYDLNRAYLWASTQGLPRIESMRFSRDPGGRFPGLYRITLHRVSPNAPYPFNTYTEVNASTEEIDEYGLSIAAIHGGYHWTDSLPADCCTKLVDKLSFGKFVAKAYWGRWAGTAGVSCSTHGKTWALSDNKQNLVWAHMIVSRVKQRLYQFTSTAAHIYVDSIIIPHELPTSTELGAWKLEKDYPNGVEVARTGMYGAIGAGWDASTGRVA
jgi:hypothetical protein